MTLAQQGIQSFKVEIAFGASAIDYVILVDDVTSYVRDVSITRGKTDDFQDFSSGSATVTLDNRDRRFDPSNVSGPHFGFLRPRTRIVIKAIDMFDETNILFNGFISGWPQHYDVNNKEATVTLSCYDLMAVASQIDMPTDPSKAVALAYADPYTRFYRFGDFLQQGDVVYDSAMGVNAFCEKGPGGAVIPTNTVVVGPELAPELNGTSSLFVGPDTGVGYETLVYSLGELPMNFREIAFGGWMKVDNNTFDYSDGSNEWMVSVGDHMTVGLTLDGYICVSSRETSLTYAISSTNVVDATSHHWMIKYDIDLPSPIARVRIYLDGVEDTGYSVDHFPMRTSDLISFRSKETEFYAQDWVFFLSNTNEVITNWDTYGVYPFFPRLFHGTGYNEAEMTTYQRFKLLAKISGYGEVDWFSYDNEADYQGICLEFNLNGNTLLQALQNVSRTEQGFFYCDRNGKLRFMSRYTIAQTIFDAPLMEFTDDPIYLPANQDDILGNDYTGYMEFGYDYDDSQLANNVQVVIGSGDSGSHEDPTSIAQLGKKSHSFDTLLGTTPPAQRMAEGLTNIYKSPQLKLKELRLMPTNDYQAYWLLYGDIGDRIVTRRLPQGIGAAIIENLTVLQVRHDFTPQSWEMSIYASARPLNQFFILDHSELDGPDILGF